MFVRNLTPEEITGGQCGPAVSELRDPQTLAERTKPGKQQLADHAGRLHAPRLRAAGHGRGREPRPVRRLFLPCHGSAYDTAARIRAGSGAAEPDGAGL